MGGGLVDVVLAALSSVRRYMMDVKYLLMVCALPQMLDFCRIK
jgi:hypothetical protein